VKRVRGERGYSLIEMLTVMVIMGLVMGGITSLFVSGTNAEADQNNRFQAQLNSRLSLDKIRREVHCASSVALSGTPSGSYYPTMTENSTGCGGVQYSWCTASVNGATNRFRLYRQSGATCSSAAGTKYADYLTSGTIFAYNTASGSSTGPAGSLPKLTVDVLVNRAPTKPAETYELKDDIVLRNGTRG
jgi:prepilin-type N-terminal cleavage/methylation domain-containing protein